LLKVRQRQGLIGILKKKKSAQKTEQISPESSDTPL